MSGFELVWGDVGGADLAYREFLSLLISLYHCLHMNARELRAFEEDNKYVRMDCTPHFLPRMQHAISFYVALRCVIVIVT